MNSHSTQVGGAHDFEAYYAASSLAAENANAVREGDLQSSQLADLANDNNSSAVSKYANGSVRELMVLLRYKGLSRVKHPLFISTRYVLYFPNPNTVCPYKSNYSYTLRKTDTFLFTPRFFLYVLLAGLLSSFFYGQNRTLVGIFNSIGILFISVILPCFMAQVFVEEMKFDREVYTREFNDAYYRAGTYVAHRVLVEVRIGAFPNPGTLFTRTRLTLSFTYLRSPP